jgi:glycosyltransferase involved in cell wall biosynthesis
VARSADAFDIIHFHTDYLHFPLFAQRWRKTLTTMHGRLDLPDLPPVLREFAMMPLVSISTAQRAPMPWANWYGTVYHGLPRNLYAAGSGDGGYLAFIGRICPEKRPDWAIEIARRADLPLTIAAKVDKADRTYYRPRIKPLLKDPLVEFVGEIGDSDKGAFLGDAMALLFPIDWPEPFGLVLIAPRAQHHHRIDIRGRPPLPLHDALLNQLRSGVVRITKPLCDDPLEVVGVHELEDCRSLPRTERTSAMACESWK